MILYTVLLTCDWLITYLLQWSVEKVYLVKWQGCISTQVCIYRHHIPQQIHTPHRKYKHKHCRYRHTHLIVGTDIDMQILSLHFFLFPCPPSLPVFTIGTDTDTSSPLHVSLSSFSSPFYRRYRHRHLLSSSSPFSFTALCS